MKTFGKLTLLSALIMFMFACQKEDANIEKKENKISDEVIAKVASLELNTDDIELRTETFLDGTSKEMYIIEGDVAISPEQLKSMQLYDGVTSEQYKTHNLVNVYGSRTITVIGYTGSGNALTSEMQTGLQGAIDNYNALNLELKFELTFGTNYQDKDIVVYQVSGAAGGMAGFPENGNPYKWVQIFSGLNSYSDNVIRHVIGHEIGHCLGFRHTDWATRQSCGSYSPEPANPYGAIHIPGTPTGYDATSYMKACFNIYVSGEFNNNDKIALKYLY
jgi:hypothetical protein